MESVKNERWKFLGLKSAIFEKLEMPWAPFWVILDLKIKATPGASKLHGYLGGTGPLSASPGFGGEKKNGKAENPGKKGWIHVIVFFHVCFHVLMLCFRLFKCFWDVSVLKKVLFATTIRLPVEIGSCFRRWPAWPWACGDIHSPCPRPFWKTCRTGYLRICEGLRVAGLG